MFHIESKLQVYILSYLQAWFEWGKIMLQSAQQSQTVRFFQLVFLTIAMAGCVSPVATQLSGEITGPTAIKPDAGLTIGLVADSQLQTRSNANLVFGYRDRLAEFGVETAIRPPALDWSARAMLRARLFQLKRSGAKVIFYLGDGANNGCHDEFAKGFEDGSADSRNYTDRNDKGILAILDEFRRDREGGGIPVFFIMGNHDLLGAGSTGSRVPSERLCEDVVGAGSGNHALTKFDVMALTDRFNRTNPGQSLWRYKSNFTTADNGAALRAACFAPGRQQHRNPGCYLAAKLDYLPASVPVQFFLLDTNDWADVSQSSYLGGGRYQQYGERGAMSFRDPPGALTPSQTYWFKQYATSSVDQKGIRIALTHYNLGSLKRNVPFIKFGDRRRIGSRKSQRFSRLFTDENPTRNKLQEFAYVLSGHTHNSVIEEAEPIFMEGCFPLIPGLCSRHNRFKIKELNVGSTTDFPSYAALVSLNMDSAESGQLLYSYAHADRASCAPVYAELRNFSFPTRLEGTRTGWRAIGIDQANRENYRGYDLDRMTIVWDNLAAFVDNNEHRAECIGLYSAAVEESPLVNPENPVLPDFGSSDAGR